MKKQKLLIFLSTVMLPLTGCKISDFNYNNKDVVISDTLETVSGEKAHVVFLYGQSNAVGISSNDYLKKNDLDKYNEYLAGYENVYINYINDYNGNTSDMAFRKATLGCGCNEVFFGPEMGIAEQMSKAHPSEKTFIIKWAWSGTILKTQWLDGLRKRGKLYNYAMDFSLKCLDYLKSKGYNLSIDGICWMQGESDAGKNRPNSYYKDTKAFVAFLRHDLDSYQSSIRFVDAGINEQEGIWKKPEIVNQAKKKFANESELNFYIDSKALGLDATKEPESGPDLAHFDALSMVKLGNAFGEIVGK